MIHKRLMACPDDATIHALLCGTLVETNGADVRKHIDRCEPCSQLLVHLVSTRRIGTRAGRYEILELIGGGAMGEVYRARDPELNRDVALKLVRAGASEVAQKRLLREARAMARIEHPNVIRVYDVGTTGNEVFLAMERIRGCTLRSWLTQKARPWREVVAALIQAGEGLSAAHSAGLIHRDFKPENVLVAEDGSVLVTDFGLVDQDIHKTQEDQGGGDSVELTATGSVVGTPAYMPPELFDGSSKADAASDQFSFCVTLYEALCGRRPFVGSTLPELRDSLIAGHVELQPLLSAPRRIRSVIRRGLSCHKGDRYPDMEQLVGHLKRITSGRLLLAGLVAVGLLVAVITTWAATRPEAMAPCTGGSEALAAWDDDARKQVLATFDGSSLPYSSAIGHTVQSSLDDYRTKWLTEYKNACKATHVLRSQSADLLDRRMECLDNRRIELQAFVAELKTADSTTIREASTSVNRLTPPQVCADVAVLKAIVPLPEAPERRRLVVALRTALARCRAQRESGRYDDAYNCTTELESKAANANYSPLTAEVKLESGRTLLKLNRWAVAFELLEATILAAESGRHHRVRFEALASMVSAAAESARYAEGVQWAKLATAILSGLGDNRQLVADLAFRVALLNFRQGQLKDAVTKLTHCVSIREELYGEEHSSIAEPLVLLAAVEATQNNYARAEKAIDRAIAIQRRTLGDEHPDVGRSKHTLSTVYIRLGRYQEALAAQEQSFELLSAAYGTKHRLVGHSLGNAADIYYELGKLQKAESLAQRVVAIHEDVSGDEHPDTATSIHRLGAILARQERHEEALSAKRRALALREKTLGPKHVHTTSSMLSVAMELRMLGQCREALPILARAQEAREQTLGKSHPRVASVMQTMADCHVDLGQGEKAVGYLERVLEIRNKGPSQSHSDRVALAMTRYGLARALWDSKQRKARTKHLAHLALSELRAMNDDRAKAVALWMKNRHIAVPKQ